ncbi:ABC transporter ATP-binding protein [Candidatus Bathyarchaeota archaeon]|nr:ABC transporter ATP-binding protein [Candidatus Bathyarchaeota archaeon]
MPKVEVQNLSKEYAGRQVLKDMTFSVQSGELFVLVGPNGAGKTTLLRILDLLDEPTSGKILLDGEIVNYSAKNKAALRRKIGMVFQQTVLFNMSVFDNVAYPLKVRNESERNIEQMVKKTLELVQLNGFERKNALALSGGEAQRVAIAQALVIEPELLLLDEPTANLDPRNVSIVEEVLSYVNRERKTTIVMTTHNMFQAENLADRLAFLNEGKIELMGTFQEISGKLSGPVKSFARMENVFHGFSKITAEGTSIVDIGGGLQIEAAFNKVGNVTLHVPPEDIILSVRPLISSARNTFEGKITQISDMGHVVKLKVNVGANKNFTVQITKRSFNEMQLNIDSKVYIAFKASSVQIK